MSESVDVQLRMSWHQICQIACRCMCMGISIDEFAELAIRDRIKSEQP